MHESQWCATVHSQIHSDTPFGQRAVCYILMPPCHILCYTRAAKLCLNIGRRKADHGAKALQCDLMLCCTLVCSGLSVSSFFAPLLTSLWSMWEGGRGGHLCRFHWSWNQITLLAAGTESGLFGAFWTSLWFHCAIHEREGGHHLGFTGNKSVTGRNHSPHLPLCLFKYINFPTCVCLFVQCVVTL